MRKILSKEVLVCMKQLNFNLGLVHRVVRGNRRVQMRVLGHGLGLSLVLGLGLVLGMGWEQGIELSLLELVEVLGQSLSVGIGIVMSTVSILPAAKKVMEKPMQFRSLTAAQIFNRYTRRVTSLYPKHIDQDYRHDLAQAMEEEYREVYKSGKAIRFIQLIIQSNLWLFWDIVLTHTAERLIFLSRRTKL